MFNVSGDAAERLRYLLGGVAGALIYGVFTFMQLIKLGHRPSLGDYGGAALNVTAAMIVAAIAAPTLGPSLVSLIPWVSLRDLPTIDKFNEVSLRVGSPVHLARSSDGVSVVTLDDAA